MTLDFVFKTCTGHGTSYWFDRGELDWFERYADPREDSGKGVLTANWNHFPRAAACDSHRSDEGRAAQEFNWSNKGRAFQDVLERMGYHLEWSDQTTRCDECYMVCVESDGHDCNQFWMDDNGVTCAECTRKDPAAYLEYLEESAGRALGIHGVKLADHEYTEVQCGFENGFHPGQNDNPKTIKRELVARGYDGIVFEISDLSQFSIGFCVWARVTPAAAFANAMDWIEYEGETVDYTEVRL